MNMQRMKKRQKKRTGTEGDSDTGSVLTPTFWKISRWALVSQVAAMIHVRQIRAFKTLFQVKVSA
jgi:hypothetical protein